MLVCQIGYKFLTKPRPLTYRDIIIVEMSLQESVDPSTFVKLKSTLVLVLVLIVLGVVGFFAYKIFKSIADGVQEALGRQKRFELADDGSVNINVKHRTHEHTLDSAQRLAYKAWQNSKAPDSYDGPLKYREQGDSRPDRGMATRGANRGWA